MAARTKTPTFNYADWVAERARDFTGRAWLFRAVDDWLNDPDGRRFFLLTGEPGSGKSAVAARLLQFSRRETPPPAGATVIAPGFLSASHICSARDRRWINPLAFSESLALQLAARYPAFAEALVERQADRSIQMDVRQTVDHVEGGRVTGIAIKNLHLGRLSPEDAFLRVVREPLEALFESGFGSGRAAPILILVDALDESLLYAGGDGIVPLLAQADFLPAGVQFLLTTRPDERVLNQFVDAAELNISAEARARQNWADVTAFIRRSLEEKAALAQAAADLEPAQQETLVDDVAGRADGNFLYVRFLLDEAAATRRSLADLDALPHGLDGLYFHSLDRVVKVGEGSWRDDYAPLIGLLSAAQESLTESQLETFADRPDVWSLLGDLGQFIDTLPPESDEDEVRYRLYHQSVADFLGRRHVQLDGRRLRNTYYLPPEPWHRAIAAHYWEQHGDDWSRCDRYGLNNLAAHLYQGQQFERLSSLINQEWMAARFEHDDYTYDGFLADLDLAWEHAHREAHRQAKAGEEPAALVDCLRYALIQTSINSLSSNYEPALVARALESGLWSGRRAMSVSGRIPESTDRAKMFAALVESGKLGPDLQPEALARGLDAVFVREPPAGYSQVRLDTKIRAFFALLGSVYGTEDKESPVDAATTLTALAPDRQKQPGAPALEEGLAAALAIGDEQSRANVLTALVPHLEGQSRSRAIEGALAAASAIEGKWSKRFQAEALTALALHLEGQPQAQALERARAAAMAIEHQRLRAKALSSLLPHLEGKARSQALEQGLAAALAIEDERGMHAFLTKERSQSMALAELVPHLEGEARAHALERGLAAAMAIGEEAYSYEGWLSAEWVRMGTLTKRVNALATLVPHLDGQERAQALESALEAILNIAGSLRAEALTALAPRLEGRALERGLEAALAIADKGWRAKALSALAPHLEDPARAEALERGLGAALAIADKGSQANALSALAPHLEDPARAEALKRGLEAAAAVEDESWRAGALAALAPHLEGRALERGLDAALAIEGEGWRAEALTALAPHLEGRALERGLDAALAIADEQGRANLLAVFLPLVPDPEPVLAEIRTAVADHLRHNLAHGERKAVLQFVADKDLFMPSIFSRSTLAAIADQLVEVTTDWRWQ